MIAGQISNWELVRTADGYFGIVTDAQQRYVFLSNGCEQKMDEAEFAKLNRMPVNIYHSGAPASFTGIERSLLFERKQKV